MKIKVFQDLKLGIKLNLILILIFIVTILSSGFMLSNVLDRKARSEVQNKALLAMSTMDSVRNYTSSKIKPHLVERLATESEFLSETVPAYSAREVFEGLRKNPNYQDFFYKEATLNPTNLRDRADGFETDLVGKFRQNNELKEISGYRNIGEESLYYVARPMAIKKASCLECHSTPEKAPPSLINTYGSDNGFGWKLNEIVAAQMVSVPATKVFAIANKLKLSIMGTISLFFLIAISFINLFLWIAIVKPVQKMSKLATKVSTGDLETEFEHTNNDEIGILAKGLERMRVSLKMAMEMIDGDQDFEI